MKHALSALPAVIALSLLAPACGDGDGGGAPAAPFQSSQQDETSIAALSPSEQEAFCQELGAYFTAQVPPATFKRLTCYSFALAFSGGDAAACNSAAKSCIDDPEGGFEMDDGDCDTTRLQDCSATVAELEACYTASATSLKSLAARLSCSMSPSELEGIAEKPAACQTVEAKCPKLFGEEDETTEPPQN